jgi:hypothetical protein
VVSGCVTHCALLCACPLQKGVFAATEDLSQEGHEEDVWADWESITDAVESRQWLQKHVVITRGMVHAAAAAFAETFKEVSVVCSKLPGGAPGSGHVQWTCWLWCAKHGAC